MRPLLLVPCLPISRTEMDGYRWQVLLSATMHSKLGTLASLSLKDPVSHGFRCVSSQLCCMAALQRSGLLPRPCAALIHRRRAGCRSWTVGRVAQISSIWTHQTLSQTSVPSLHSCSSMWLR